MNVETEQAIAEGRDAVERCARLAALADPEIEPPRGPAVALRLLHGPNDAGAVHQRLSVVAAEAAALVESSDRELASLEAAPRPLPGTDAERNLTARVRLLEQSRDIAREDGAQLIESLALLAAATTSEGAQAGAKRVALMILRDNSTAIFAEVSERLRALSVEAGAILQVAAQLGTYDADIRSLAGDGLPEAAQLDLGAASAALQLLATTGPQELRWKAPAAIGSRGSRRNESPLRRLIG